MMETGRKLLSPALVLMILITVGCAATSPPVTFYTLGYDVSGVQDEPDLTTCSDKGISIGPVRWPRYLDQPRIVTRIGPNKLNFDEFNRWGGSLQDDFTQLLKRNLSGLLRSSKIADTRINRRFTPEYRIEMDIKQFDGRLGDEVILDVAWVIIASETGKTLAVHDATIARPVSGQGYDALVSASSAAVTALSDELAAGLMLVCVD